MGGVPWGSRSLIESAADAQLNDLAPHFAAQVLPLLREVFGEGLAGRLRGLASESAQLAALVSAAHLSPLWRGLRLGPGGGWLDCQPLLALPPALCSQALYHVCHRLGLPAFRSVSLPGLPASLVSPPPWPPCLPALPASLVSPPRSPNLAFTLVPHSSPRLCCTPCLRVLHDARVLVCVAHPHDMSPCVARHALLCTLPCLLCLPVLHRRLRAECLPLVHVRQCCTEDSMLH